MHLTNPLIGNVQRPSSRISWLQTKPRPKYSFLISRCNRDILPGNRIGAGGKQKHKGRDYVLRCQQAFNRAGLDIHLLDQIGNPEELGVNHRRGYGIHRHMFSGVLGRQALHQAEQGMLGAGIGGRKRLFWFLYDHGGKHIDDLPVFLFYHQRRKCL